MNIPSPSLQLFKKFLTPGQDVPYAPKAKGCIRIATFNVHFGRDPQAIARLFKQNRNLARADVVLLQEMEHQTKEKLTRTIKVVRGLKLPHFAYVPDRDLIARRGTHGIAMVSRWPLENLRTIRLPFFPMPLPRPRVAMSAGVTIGGRTVTIYNIHLNGTLNLRERIRQLDTAVKDIQTQAGDGPIILGGDFNTIPLLMLARAVPVFYSNQKKKFHDYLKDHGFETTCQTAGYTLESGLVRFQLDGIYTKNAPVVQCAVERGVKVSDHFPLWADIRV